MDHSNLPTGKRKPPGLLVFYLLGAMSFHHGGRATRNRRPEMALFQIAFMIWLACFAALAVYQTLRHLG
jgi:hypothetical protein